MKADYIVVGTGSAGSVLANRLSGDPATEVIVLEAGPRDKNRLIRVPVGFTKLLGSEVDWAYRTQPQKELDGREIYWPRGKMLGGTSSMNAMMWVRGFAADYDAWGELAGEQWSFTNVEHYFGKIENGPLVISAQRSPRSSTGAWLTAAQQSGYRMDQPNCPEPDGFCETRVNQRRGARWSSADGYLRPALARPNLRLITEATVTRVLFDQNRVVGVEFAHNGVRRQITATREVVLCAGAVNTPQLLLLSGIGDREQLADHGIDAVHHLPGVGQNLIDHLFVPLGFDVSDDTLTSAQQTRQLINYLVRRGGMLTSNLAEAYGFVRSRDDLELPDLELMFAPAPFFDEGIGDPYLGHAVAFGPILLKPRSRGTISLRSSDPTDKPIIDPRYLTDDANSDRETLMAGLRICATLATAPAMANLLGTIARPLGARELTEETLQHALNTVAHSLYHPVGTCRMGSDAASVVDPQLRVRGVHGLRIADASVMPTIIRGHTHAPSVLIGEKAADLIRADR